MEPTMKQTRITEDQENGKKLFIAREFDATRDQVWKAWTEKELLDQWWAPKPWKTSTRSLDFREGGTWIYAMKGPEGEVSWCRADFQSINAPKSYTASDAFCDESGKELTDFPKMLWKTDFLPTPAGTRVEVEISFETEDDLKKIVEMGFKEGFTAAHSNLDELLANQKS